MSRGRIALLVATVALGGAACAVYLVILPLLRDPFVPIYDESCSVCRGESLEGTPIGAERPAHLGRTDFKVDAPLMIPEAS